MTSLYLCRNSLGTGSDNQSHLWITALRHYAGQGCKVFVGKLLLQPGGDIRAWIRKLLDINHSKPRWRSLFIRPCNFLSSHQGWFWLLGKTEVWLQKSGAEGNAHIFPHAGAKELLSHEVMLERGWLSHELSLGGLVRCVGSGWLRPTSVMWMGCRSSQPELNPSLAKVTKDPRRTSQIQGTWKHFSKVIF